jgi:hypothetical protein
MLRYLFGEIVEDDDSVLSVVTEILTFILVSVIEPKMEGSTRGEGATQEGVTKRNIKTEPTKRNSSLTHGGSSERS